MCTLQKISLYSNTSVIWYSTNRMYYNQCITYSVIRIRYFLLHFIFQLDDKIPIGVLWQVALCIPQRAYTGFRKDEISWCSLWLYVKFLQTCRLYPGGLPQEVRLLIYRQVTKPDIIYAFPAWFGISSHQMEKLRLCERRVFRSCLGLR